MPITETDLLSDPGHQMHLLASRLFPICRSLTGDGVRETLKILKEVIVGLRVEEIPSGTKLIDWTVPEEWVIRDAWVAGPNGDTLIDFKENNLHLVGYSVPVNRTMTREELELHLHSLPDQPNAIPYVTSYYERRWGFCISEEQRRSLGDGPFHVFIDSDLKAGSLTLAEAVVPGTSSDEVLLSTYICHPSMANNELSGPVVAAALYQWLLSTGPHHYTYRFVFAPETIGSIAYISRNLENLKNQIKAGWVLTCLGDERSYSYVPSRLGDTLADRVSRQVLSEISGDVRLFSFLDRGSDERQWCSPGVDLPVCSVMRSKYGTYPEYHTSLDDLSLVTAEGLRGGLDLLKQCIRLLEANLSWQAVYLCEPQLGRRGLYSTTSYKGSADSSKLMMDILAYCDSTHDVIDLCERLNVSSAEVLETLQKLSTAGLIKPID